MYKYIHVSYKVKSTRGNVCEGETLLKIKKGGNIKRVREFIKDILNENDDKEKYEEIPVIICLSEISKELYDILIDGYNQEMKQDCVQ